MHSIPAVVASATLSMFVCTHLVAQRGASPHCDPLVDVQNTGPGTYKERGDRCEGVYVQKVSGGTGLRIASLTDAFPNFKFAAGDSLHLAWNPDGQSAVRLRAVSMGFRQYYRMDSVRPAGSSSWVWPAEVLALHGLSSRDVGLVALMRRPFNDGERDVYVPVRLGRNAAPPSDKTLTLVVVPASILKELYFTVTLLKPDGSLGASVVDTQDVKQGPYPADQGIRVSLPPLPQTGYYSIELEGVTEKSKPVSVGLTIYNAR